MKRILISIAISALLVAPAFAGDHGGGHAAAHAESVGAACTGFGPQTPRDIDNVKGKNGVHFNIAPAASNMNLCNIHFHENAEHKSKGFSIYAGDGHAGYGSGYKCDISTKLSKAELAPTKHKICDSKHGDLVPGDTIEVHWVHSTCDVQPGPTLGSCLSKACANPELRVETQVFTLVNDSHALNFNKLKLAKDLPTNTGKPVEFIGSTTGPSFSEQTCSPYQVTWNVRPNCAKLDINSVGEWCKGNVFNEDHAHGVRKLVTNPDLLSEIK
ncbi:MAG: delta-class carbonic anhydrase [Mariprofundaceae bacterium]